MRNSDQGRIGIPPGDMLRLFEGLNIGAGKKDATTSFMAPLVNYVSDRSVALLLRSGPERLELGSGVCVRIADRYLVATVKHNLQDDQGAPLKPSDLEIRAQGEKYGEALKVLHMGLSPNLDLAWLELDPASSKRPWLAFVTGDQIAFLDEDTDRQLCLLVGYPAQLVETSATVQHRPLLESTGLLTLSIAPGRRTGPRDYGTFAIEYPPHDNSLNEVLPIPHGVSGGGIWLLPALDKRPIWSPEVARLVGFARSWRKDCREEVVLRIESWLKLVASQMPELGEEVERITLAQLVQRLTGAYHPTAIYLFGSRARGNQRPASDYDLLVVVPNDAPEELHDSRKGYDCLAGIAAAVDVMVCTEDYFTSREHVRTSLPARVMREGKLVYAA